MAKSKAAAKSKVVGRSGGKNVTEADLDRIAREAEAGYDVDKILRRRGRRPMGSAAAEVVPVRLDPELRAAVEARAEEEGATTSDVIRRALRRELDLA